ncbi:hypothetical protein JCM11957_08050 [Caminibacter profundus]
MGKIKKYLIIEYLPIFFSLFFIISLIISLIFIVSISNITAGLQITFIDLMKMYLLSLPQIIFITLSIAFFISANTLFAKLSETQELVALFSLGFKPIKLLSPIIFIAFILTIINLFILLVSIPYSKIAFNNLKNEKKQETKFNFESAQISQQFGEWSVFAQKNKEKSYSNIYLYNTKESKFILAKKANLKGSNGSLKFTMTNGKVYDFNSSYVINFEKMHINQKIPKIKISIFNFKNYFNYNKKLFIKYLPFALLPIALLFFIPILSFFHPRLYKNRYLLYSIALLGVYITLAFANKNILMSIIIPFTFLIAGGILYKWKVKF